MPFLRRRGNQVSETEAGHNTSTAIVNEPSAEVDARPHAEASEASSTPNSELPKSHSPTASAHRQGSDPHPRPESPPTQEQSQKHRRFSTLRFRNASDSQLSLRFKQQAEDTPPVPTPRTCFPHPRRRPTFALSDKTNRRG